MFSTKISNFFLQSATVVHCLILFDKPDFDDDDDDDNQIDNEIE